MVMVPSLTLLIMSSGDGRGLVPDRAGVVGTSCRKAAPLLMATRPVTFIDITATNEKEDTIDAEQENGFG